jgi:MFS family permease
VAKWLQAGSPRYEVLVWIGIALISEIFPIGTLVVFHVFMATNKGFREILGYSGLAAVAVGILAAIIGDIVMGQLYDRFKPLMVLTLAVVFVAVAVPFFWVVALDVDANSGRERLHHPNEAWSWFFEIAFVCVIFGGTGFAKSWAIRQPPSDPTGTAATWPTAPQSPTGSTPQNPTGPVPRTPRKRRRRRRKPR